MVFVCQSTLDFAFVHLKDRFTSADGTLMFDSQSNDWTALNGREQNGWTIAQIKRPLNPCDPMDVPIKVSFKKQTFTERFQFIDQRLVRNKYCHLCLWSE